MRHFSKKNERISNVGIDFEEIDGRLIQMEARDFEEIDGRLIQRE